MMGADRKHKGTRAEYLACAWLLGEGYEVFRNISPFGEADLIAVRGSHKIEIDVKTASDVRLQPLTGSQIKRGVVVLHVTEDGRVAFGFGAASGCNA